MHTTTHHPPHVYLDDTWYMITSSVVGSQPLLRSDEHIELVRDRLRELTVEFHLALRAWVILPNHNHILVKSHAGRQIRDFMRRWHGRTSFDLNKRDDARGRRVWHNYWDSCVREESDYWMRFNYIHYNPVKHGHAASMGSWKYSSYGFYARREGEAWLTDVMQRHPVVDFADPNDRFGGEDGREE